MNNSKNVQVANMYEVIELLKQLGIETALKKGNINFYDDESDEIMEIWEWNRYGYCDKRKNPITLSEIAANKKLILLSLDKNLILEMKNPLINGEEDKNSLIISKVFYSNVDEDYVIELQSQIPEQLYVKYYPQGDIENGIYTEMKIRGDNNLWISNVEYNISRKGLFNSQLDNNYDLTASEMVETINNNNVIKAFVDYYGNHFPGIAHTIESIKKEANGYSK